MTALVSQGFKLWIADGLTPPTFFPIGEIRSISEFGSSPSNLQDVTTLDDNARQFVPGIPDFGEAQCEYFRDFTDPGQQHAQRAYEGQLLRDFRLTYDRDPAFLSEFEGWVIQMSISMSVDEAVNGTLTVRANSRPTGLSN